MIEFYKYTDAEKEELFNSITIIIDTREKKYDHIKTQFDEQGVPYIRKKLDYGDYSFLIPKNEKLGIERDIYFDKKVVIERKASLDEVAGNLTKDRTRFKSELVMTSGREMVLLIENGSYEKICLHDYRTNLSPKSYLCSLHAFAFRYNTPFFFVEDQRFSWVFIRMYFYNWFHEYLKGHV